MRVLITLLTIAASLSSCVNVDLKMEHRSLVADWRDEIIYQVVVDRFDDGDPSNNFNVDYRKEAAYHGGDWQGVIDRLDYIESLGVTALWISPIVKNVENDAGFASYHGYWTQDFTRVNPHFGDLAKLQQLVKACHSRGIKVILDIVTNHVGQLFYYDINRNGQPDTVFYGGGGSPPGSRTTASGNPDSQLTRVSEWDPEFDYRGVQGFTSLGENGPSPIVWVNDPSNHRTPPRPAEFHNDSWYNQNGRVTVWEDECRCFRGCDGTCSGLYEPWKDECNLSCWNQLREQEMLGDFPGGLKDLDTKRDDVRQALISVFQYWIEVGGFDGFRIDTLKHVEPEFFDVFAPAMRAHAAALGKTNFFMFGEAFDGKDFLLGSYTHGQGVDSVFYFSAKYRIFDGVFGRRGAPSEIKRLYDERLELTPVGDVVRSQPCTDGDPGCRTRYSNQPKVNGLIDEDGNGVGPDKTLVHFVDNHDVPRFLSQFPDRNALRNALAFLLTTDGVPCIYYGTEQDFEGGPDPSNREDMWQSGFRQDGQTFRYTKKLIALRKRLAPLRRGDMTFVFASPEASTGLDGTPTAGLLMFERRYKEETVLVVINNHDSKTARTLGEQGSIKTNLAGNLSLVDLMDDSGEYQVVTDADGGVDISIPPNSMRVFTTAR
ncbi:MAG: alpha-amylase family glycosyl hydrolase [Myxococcota bacterium]|nr:alpha-amylase family glycosyl hydrolase [Myxococcota bacterium]